MIKACHECDAPLLSWGVLMPRTKEFGDRNDVGQRIVELRRARGWKQGDLLAKLQTEGCDMPQSSLSDLEGQKRKVSDRELTALANIFGVVLEELYNKT